ncbi:MAG: glycosyltransferase, partial [Pseudomonadales bacterium]
MGSIAAISKKTAEAFRRFQALRERRGLAAALLRSLDHVRCLLAKAAGQLGLAAGRFVRYGHLDKAGNIGLYQLARFIGRRLPLPHRLRIKVRDLLLRKQYPKHLRHNRIALAVDRLASGLGIQQQNVMRPECCGLVPDLVSLVLPVYNQADLLEESIDSVLAQTYQNFELILINDGSTDDIASLLDKYSRNPKVRCFTQANQHLPKTLSNGFNLARGEFWSWTSADNIMEPQMLERLVAKLKAEPALGMVYADYYAIDGQGQPLQDKGWRAHNRPKPNNGEIRLPQTTEDLSMVQDNFIGPCFMYRGWIGRTLGDYEPQTGIEDYDYWMRINAFYPVRHLGSADPLYRYRVHDNTLTAQAGSHGILKKVQHLMEHEKQRAAYYQSQLEVIADAVGMQWLNLEGVVDVNFTPMGSLHAPNAPEAAELILVGSATAVQALNSLVSLQTPTAVIFEREDQRYQQLQQLLQRDGCIALTHDKPTADRIRLVADCLLLDAKGHWANIGTLAFAKNRCYFRQTHYDAALLRDMPAPVTRSRARHLLLQVDSFMQGGMENVVIDLAHSLQEAGFQITIANFGQAGDAVAKAREQGLRVETFIGISTETYMHWLRHNKVALVNAHYSLFAADACRQAGIPFIETIHNTYVWLEPDMLQAYRQADAGITAYLCVSHTVARYADLVLGLDVGKMRIVPNGIDASKIDASRFAQNRQALRDAWAVSPEAPVFLNVASIMATKAQLPLVKAYASVLEQHPDARLVLLGEVMQESYLQEVKKAVDELGIADSVIFAGYDRNAARYYHAADVFVLPSYWEGWSLSLGEAIANGLACVITDVGSAYEFADRPGVEVVTPPFSDVTALDFSNLGQFLYQENPHFTQALAEAMLRAVQHGRRGIDEQLIEQLDGRRAYGRYASV